jgi:drug/metabolite transporter (DMT)-like permease
MSQRSLAVLSLIIVALGYSLMSVATRWMSSAFMPMTQVYLRLALAAVVAAGLWGKGIRWQSYRELPRRDLMSLLMMGTVGYALVVYFVTMGALNTSLLNVSLLYSTVPFWVGIIGYFFFRQKIGIKKIMILLLSMYGVGIVASGMLIPSVGGFGRGELFTVISAICAACYVWGRKMLSDKLNDKEIAVAALIIAAISSWVLAMIMGEPPIGTGWWSDGLVVWGLVVGGVLNIVASYLEVYAFRILDGVAGAQLLLTDNIWALLLGIGLYDEWPTVVQGVGAIMIISAVYRMNRLEAKN